MCDYVVRGIRRRPVTTCFLVAIGFFCFWMAWTIHEYVVHYPHARLVSFTGPLSLFPFHAWEWLFIGAGIASFIRLTVLNMQMARWDLLIHVVSTFPILLWDCAFIAGPPSAGQPTSAYLLFTVIMVPFITPLNEIALRMLRQDAENAFTTAIKSETK